MLTIARTARPRASLVMVTWNALAWSQRALAAIVHHTDVEYELIVVDNASTDGTCEVLADELRGATVVRNLRNHGFGPACNLGASRATAPVLLFVNSDVLVTPGWLTPLIAALDCDARIGAVGPRIVDLHGRLDHAGALLAHDGSTLHYGSGDDPARAEYAFSRRVDYASGACLAVRQRAFRDVGGFDPWFEVAYFEDTDLCLRLAEQGWDVVYVPSSTVRHAGGASGSPAGSLRLLGINHPRFHQRWKEPLARRPDAPLGERVERVVAARDARAAGTVLLLGNGCGEAADVAGALLALASHLRITLVAELAESAVEHVETLRPEWLSERRFHYDVVVGSDPAAEGWLRDTQPQAKRVTLDDARCNPADALIAAGIVLDEARVAVVPAVGLGDRLRP